MPDDKKHTVLMRWDYGSRADVALIRASDGVEYIEKKYRSGQALTLFREWSVLRYLERRISCVPSVISIDWKSRTVVLEFVKGERVLEWVLKRFAATDVAILDFANFHGLESNEVVNRAFESFRKSNRADANGLKRAIADAYGQLHASKFVHGDPSPRNLLFDGEHVTLIDFDHSRPSPKPEIVDGKKVARWYGVSC